MKYSRSIGHLIQLNYHFQSTVPMLPRQIYTFELIEISQIFYLLKTQIHLFVDIA